MGEADGIERVRLRFLGFVFRICSKKRTGEEAPGQWRF